MFIKIKDIPGKIRKTTLIGKDIVSMWVDAPIARFEAGQFAMLECPGFPLRRPFVIADSDKRSIRFIFKIRGKGTTLLSNLGPGTSIKILAPLGNSFPEPDKKTTPLILGGGIGIATVLPLAKKFHNEGLDPKILIGTDTKDSLAIVDELKHYGEVVVATDDGSEGIKGNVVELAQTYIQKRPTNYTLYGCGPNPMLQSLCSLSKQENFTCYISMEEKMACGVGACVCCVVKTQEGLKRACKDGPVFNAEYIKW